MTDNVNHPAHYTSHPSGIECIEVVRHYCFSIGNAIKYLDEPLHNMIKALYNEGKLRNTAVFILSEQGNKNNGLYIYGELV